MDCQHPQMPEDCFKCGAPAVAAVNTVGSCTEHLDEVFAEAAAPLGMLLMAAAEAFGEETSIHVAP
jgi:hypothetical protein